jgi:soluble lytic murein transglycosylase-like protein
VEQAEPVKAASVEATRLPSPTPTAAPVAPPAVASAPQERTLQPAPTQAVTLPAKAIATPNGYDALLQAHFGGSWQYAKKVMMCESSGRADAVGPTDSNGYNPIGLMQIKNFPGRPTTAQLMDPATNIAYAAQMIRSQGWSPWECAAKV